MPCRCERCGGPNDDCGFRLCIVCHLQERDDDTRRNLISGGRFYGEPLLNKESHIKQKGASVEHD